MGPTSHRLIVDGMNVIGSRPDGWWRDRRGAMRRLVESLEGVEGYEHVVVVLDGRPFDLSGSDQVEVLFASRRGRNAADDDIAELAGEGDTVVTSDADLERRVRSKGAAVIGAGAFRRRLDD